MYLSYYYIYYLIFILDIYIYIIYIYLIFYNINDKQFVYEKKFKMKTDKI